MEKFRKYIKPILFVLGTSFSILLFKIWLQKKNKINNQNINQPIDDKELELYTE